MITRVAAAVLCLVLAASAWADIAGVPSRVHVLTDVRIVTEPGAIPVAGALVIRDGRIEMLGAGVEIPVDAIVHERPGRVVYPGLIETYLRRSEPAKAPEKPAAADTAAKEPEKRPGTADKNARVRSDVRAAEALPLPDDLRREMREAGYTTALVAPSEGIFRGTAAVVSLRDGDPSETVLDPDFAAIFAFEHGGWGDPSYPNSLMGSIATTRQTLLDTGWHRDAWAGWRKNPGASERPPENLSLHALVPVLEGRMPIFMESEDLRMMPRALRIAREFDLRPVIVSGSADEYLRLDRVGKWLTDANASLILTVAFPKAPRWEDDEKVAIELEDLIHWEQAPADPGKLARAGIPFSVTTQGLEKRADVHRRLRRAVRCGLSPEAALAALTTHPAKLLGLEARVGTLEPGKDANLLVANGDLFDPRTQIEEVWVDGVRYGDDPKRAGEKDLEGKWDLVLGEGEEAREFRVEFEEKEGVFRGELVGEGEIDDTNPPLDGVTLVRGELAFVLPARLGEGLALVTLRLDGKMLRGQARDAGVSRLVLGRKVSSAAAKEKTDPIDLLSEGAPPWPPVADADARPAAVHVKDATIWTCGPDGVLQNADLLVVDGKVSGVGPNLDAPPDAVVIEGTGLHVTPGLIDCHSHSAISGGVNEGTNSATCEVRIGDVLNPRSHALYRELAGGLTVGNMLHGSANAIGGQNAVIKIRWGQPAEDLLFAEAPAGVKFALGENVKQSNWGDDFVTRYPQTRMGVEQFIRERFHAAEDYRHEWQDWRKKQKGPLPRRDLQLDALLEILDGDRLVHCHSYRADEIIMLIRVAEDFGFRIGTFQHVLEGYKCANEIAQHGAGASSFSDWWSYKYEVVDAIPYNGEIMWRRGVNTSYNSDSWEVSRWMNLEGEKAVKWGGVPDEEALGFVTTNPAAQLGISEWVGTLETGKHGDFVIWSQPPLSDTAMCLETWIEGVRRFSRDQDLAARGEAMRLRDRLLAAAKKAWVEEDAAGEKESESSALGAFGRKWGESETELERGLCHVHGEH
jgi:imidazolonepropionase-like amidohydrolase